MSVVDTSASSGDEGGAPDPARPPFPGGRPPGVRLRSLGGMAWRNVLARPLRALLTTAGIVLGVGLIFGVLLLTATIDSTFRNLFDSVYGKADLVVSGRSLDESLSAGTLRRVRGVDGVERAQGSLEGLVVRVRGHRRPSASDAAELNVSAVDPKAPDTAGVTVVDGRAISGGREIELEERGAQDQGLEPGERLRRATPTGVETFTVAGTFRFARTFGFGGEGFARMPLRTGREVLDKPRGYDQIAVVVADGQNLERVRRRVQRAAGRDVEVTTPRGKSDDVSEQLRGLNVILLFFAGMGLFVGAFLIFNSFQITVLQRGRELGMLRTLGASRAAVTRGVLREAALLGAVGTALGLGLGVALAVGLVALMGVIGFPVSGLAFSAPALAAAVASGLLVTVLGALWPARRAGRVAPIRAVLGLAEERRPPSVPRAIAGATLTALGLGGVFLLASADDVLPWVAAAGIAGVVFLLLGVALAAPVLIAPLVRVLSWPLRLAFPIEGRLAADAAKANPGRTAATASGLMIGLALVTAFGSLGSSFLGSIKEEFDKAFARDFTVQPRGFQPGAGRQQSISPRLRERIAALPEAAVVTPERLIVARQPDGQEGLMFAFDPAQYAKVDNSEFTGASEEEAHARVARGQVTVAEALAASEGIQPGERITLGGSSGRRRPRVAAIVKTAIFGGQTIGMSLETMEAIYGVTRDTDLAVKAVSAEARPRLERRVERIVDADYPQLQVLSNDELKRDIESQVNRQFGFFNALLAVAVLVSLFGVINTLSMNVLERTREIGVLRALGSSRWQVRRAIGEEGLLLSMVGALLGIVVGIVLGYVFVRGVAAAVPSVSYAPPLTTILFVAVAGVVLGLLAAVLPARRAARMDVVRALAYE